MAALDLRGQIYREKRLMKLAEAAEFLRRQKIANVGTVDRNGWPYVVPLVYIYEGGGYLHTGDHQGHFLTNVQNHPQICVEVSEIGGLHRGTPYAYNSTLVYASAIAFGPASVLDGPESRKKKAWFLDRLMTKYGEPEWSFEPGYPLIDRIVLCEQKIEVVTGKQSNDLITEQV